MVLIPFEWFEVGFESFKSLSNGSNLVLKAWNLFRIVRINIEMLRSHSNGSNLHSNASNFFRMVRSWIRKLRITFEWFQLGFESLESFSNSSN